MDLETVPPVLDPDADGDTPLTVVPLFSGGASGARYLEDNDPQYGDAYHFPVAVTTDPEAAGIDRLEAPVDILDIHAFYDERNAPITDKDVRRAYDDTLREHLASYDPDLLMLSGYMYLLTEPVLATYPAINVHPADLRLTAPDGERRFTGMDAVYDAVAAGETETRSSVHFVTKGVDEGPLLVVSPPAPVHEAMIEDFPADGDRLRRYVDLHQDWMKDRCDGPALRRALHLLAAGRVALTDAGVTVDRSSDPDVMDGEA